MSSTVRGSPLLLTGNFSEGGEIFLGNERRLSILFAKYPSLCTKDKHALPTKEWYRTLKVSSLSDDGAFFSVHRNKVLNSFCCHANQDVKQCLKIELSVSFRRFLCILSLGQLFALAERRGVH